MSKREIPAFVAEILGDQAPSVFKNILGFEVEPDFRRLTLSSVLSNDVILFSPAGLFFSGSCFRARALVFSKLSWIEKLLFVCVSVRRAMLVRGRAGNLVGLRSCNGIVVIDMDKARVFKLCAPYEAEPHFITNELAACKSLPDHVPSVLRHGQEGALSFLVSEYIPSDRRFRFRQWPRYLKRLLPLMIQHYKNSGLMSESWATYRGDLALELEECRGLPLFSSEMTRICQLADEIEKKFCEIETVHKVFAHGDLVPNNILVSKGKLYIFDWANGGWQNAFYDLMMQKIYFAESNLWKRFFALDDNGLDSEFFGWSREFCAALKMEFGLKFDTQFVRQNIFYSILELAIKNCRRYQWNEMEYRNGADMLQTVLRVLGHVLESAD